MKNPSKFILILLIVCYLPFTVMAKEGADEKALILVKILGYVRGIDTKSKTLRLGVVYNPSNLKSVQDSKAMRQSLEQTETFLSVDLVSILSLSDNADHSIFLIGQDLSEHFDSIRDIAQKNRIFTISTDPACAKKKSCVLSVDFKSSFKVYFSQEALESTGYDVDSTFRYLAIRV